MSAPDEQFAAENVRLWAALTQAEAERDRLREEVRSAEDIAASRLATLQETVRRFVHFEAPVRAVAHDSTHGPVLLAALADVLARPGWAPEDAAHVFEELEDVLWNFSWVLPGELAACGRPDIEPGLQLLAREGVRRLLSLEEPPPAAWLAAAGLSGSHLPVPDYTSPTGAQLVEAVACIDAALAAGEPVAVHCQGGRGRANAVVAAYLVHRGLTPEAAAETVVQRRPSSVPMTNLVAAGRRFAEVRRDATAP